MTDPNASSGVSAGNPGNTSLGQSLRRAADRAMRETLAEPGWTGVYCGPWWEGSGPVDSQGSGTGGVSLKCAILKRRSRGAEHWGHLFLVAGAVGSDASLSAEPLPGVARRSFGSTHSFLVTERAPYWIVLVRPIDDREGSPLIELGARFADRLRSIRLQGTGRPSTTAGD
jgi:hypothetical protein